jgi:hypothetical protein
LNREAWKGAKFIEGKKEEPLTHGRRDAETQSLEVL